MEDLKKIIEKAMDSGWCPYGGWSLHEILDDKSVNDIIFSHDFLKAFFNGLGYWQYHAQQLVLEEDRIKYLMKFL